MKSVINLLKKVPKQFRFLVLVLIAGISFFAAFQGLTEGSVAVGIIGLLAFLFVVYTFYYLITNKAQL